MLNPTTLVADALADFLETYYRRMFGSDEFSQATRVTMGARLLIEQIANTDALYHDLQHTLMVTLWGRKSFVVVS